jgi:NAD(P)-dependent dehydrogenase (short-subunit alcohol dehydrogenase family)
MSADKNLSGKTIVITGASSGFGRGSAEKLAGLGANAAASCSTSSSPRSPRTGEPPSPWRPM